jgi:hypothetical protein
MESVSQISMGDVHIRSHFSIRVTFVAMHTQQFVIISIGEIQIIVHCLCRLACPSSLIPSDLKESI